MNGAVPGAVDSTRVYLKINACCTTYDYRQITTVLSAGSREYLEIVRVIINILVILKWNRVAIILRECV